MLVSSAIDSRNKPNTLAILASALGLLFFSLNYLYISPEPIHVYIHVCLLNEYSACREVLLYITFIS